MVKQTLVFCYLASLFILSCIAPPLKEDPLFKVTEVSYGSLHPYVVKVEDRGDHLEITFSRAMDPQVLAGVGVYRLKAHAYEEVNSAGEPVPFQVRGWLSPVTLALVTPPDPGEYILVLSGLRSQDGAELDGLSPLGINEGLNRLDEDGLNAPSPYRSIKWIRGEPSEDFLTWPSFPYLKVSEITALYSSGGSGRRDQNPEILYLDGPSRVSLLPPSNDRMVFRIRFSSPAGSFFSLPSPTSLRGEVKILKEDGSEIPTRLDLSADPAVEWVGSLPPTVVAVTGMVITASSGPNQPLGNFRNPTEEVYLVLGDLPPPTGIVARILNYDPTRFQYTVTIDSLDVTGVITGYTFYSDTLIPSKVLGLGSVLWANGVSYPVADARARTITFASGALPPQGRCSPCTFLMNDLGPRVSIGSRIFFTSPLWYLHLRIPFPPSQVPLYLVINDGGNIRNLMGAPFRDEERDGWETLSPPVPEDRFVLKFSFRTNVAKVLTATQVNDGRFYPPVFELVGIDCEGDPRLPICIKKIPDPFCPGRLVEAQIFFSFATKDGDDSRPFGYSDLVNLSSLSEQTVILKDESGRPLQVEINTRTVFPQTIYGVFPTSLIEVTLRELTPQGCIRAFLVGDRLVLDHRLRFIVPEEPRTLDGDGDGVASPDPSDHWIGVFNPIAKSFLPLPRYPKRPP